MVALQSSRAPSRLHESISAFVPLFLSHRTQSRIPPSGSAQDILKHVEYVGGSPSDHGEPANYPEEHARTIPTRKPRPVVKTPTKSSINMHPPPPSHSQTSSSNDSTSTATKRSHHHKKSTRPQYYKTRPTHTRKASSTSTSTNRSRSHTTRTRTHRRKVSDFTRLRFKVESKFRITLTFGLGFLTTLVLYLGLFLSHTSSGATFHVLSILLLISFLAIFAHSLLRFISLNSELKALRAHRAGLKKTPSARGWNISRPLMQFSSGPDDVVDEKLGGSAIGRADGGYEHDGFPIFNAAAANNYNTNYDHNPYDQDVEADAGLGHYHPERVNIQGGPIVYPPPVFGDTHTSVRLSISPSQPPSPNPNNLTPASAATGHPSITAPTNAALAPGMPGWHPPSFRSEGGITAVLERRRQEVQERLGGGGKSGKVQGGQVMLGRGRYEGGGAGGLI